MPDNSYLLVPSCMEGGGTGHLKRQIDLYNKLKRSVPSSIFVPENPVSEIHKNLLEESVESSDLFMGSLPEDKAWNFIIVDYRNSPVELISILESKGLLIGIDEGGQSRVRFNYLIDIIPSSGNSIMPNIYSNGLMSLPERRLYQYPIDYKKILISFGGEDPQSLTPILLDFIISNKYFVESEITVASVKSIDYSKYSRSIKLLEKQKDFKSELYKYDLVFTSFGLTAFETLASGVPFVLLNPSSYHHKLSYRCGFFEIGIKKPSKRKLDQFLSCGLDFNALQEKYIPQKYIDLGDVILSLKNPNTVCPVCHHPCGPDDLSCRFESQNFYCCPVCKILFKVNFHSKKNGYKKEYFFEDYEKQYGRTYLEDFKNIQKSAGFRLKIIQGIKHEPRFKDRKRFAETGNSLLDVGCAYGPFLVESVKYGYSPSGVEIIPDAVEYVISEFGFPVMTGPFETVDFNNKYDVITMWYVIEHFNDINLVLSRVNSLLNLGGVFAFSTPSGSGISARKSMKDFLENSPEDHITVWAPRISAGILKRFGFRLKKIRITGHHPERFPWYPVMRSKIGYKLLDLISRLFCLGDTFEVYVEKIKELNV